LWYYFTAVAAILTGLIGKMIEITEIGKIVRFHRRQSGLSQAALARLAGVGKTVVFDIEQGKTTVKLSTLVKVLAALNIRLELISPLMTAYREAHNA
jgi:y4mF family transcriptional regulator